VVTSVPVETGSIPLGAAPTACKGSTQPQRKRTAEYERPAEKRPRQATIRGHPTSTNRLPIAPTPSSLESLKVTKPRTNTQDPISTGKDKATTSPLACISQPMSQRYGTRIQSSATTIEYLTPYPTSTSQASPDLPDLEDPHPRRHGHEQHTREFIKPESPR
jgi:hypothetical protein